MKLSISSVSLRRANRSDIRTGSRSGPAPGPFEDEVLRNRPPGGSSGLAAATASIAWRSSVCRSGSRSRAARYSVDSPGKLTFGVLGKPAAVADPVVVTDRLQPSVSWRFRVEARLKLGNSSAARASGSDGYSWGVPLPRFVKGRVAKEPPVSIGDPRLEGWETVTAFEDQKTALAWRDQLRAMGLDASCVADRPLDRFGRGDIYLVVPPQQWSRANEIIENLD